MQFLLITKAAWVSIQRITPTDSLSSLAHHQQEQWHCFTLVTQMYFYGPNPFIDSKAAITYLFTAFLKCYLFVATSGTVSNGIKLVNALIIIMSWSPYFCRVPSSFWSICRWKGNHQWSLLPLKKNVFLQLFFHIINLVLMESFPLCGLTDSSRNSFLEVKILFDFVTSRYIIMSIILVQMETSTLVAKRIIL